MVLEKTLESSLDSREIKLVNSKENQPGVEYSLEGLMLKLKLQYFGPLMQELIHWKRPIHMVKAVVFPVVMYGCESWTIRKAEH